MFFHVLGEEEEWGPRGEKGGMTTAQGRPAHRDKHDHHGIRTTIIDTSSETLKRESHGHHHHFHYYRFHDDFLYFALLSAPILMGTQLVVPTSVVKVLNFILTWLWPTMEVIFAVAILVVLVDAIYIIFGWPRILGGDVKAIRASKFDPTKIPPKLDTIVIGSGSGGSTCANLLAQSGQRVLVLEQHPTTTGGCTHSFREQNCEWDTGLHYTSKAMSDPIQRPGAIMNFMSRGHQEFTPLQDPYDEIVFPVESEDNIMNNVHTYPFWSGLEATVDGIMERLVTKTDEDNCPEECMVLKQRVRAYLEICQDINSGFTSLGISRMLPHWLQFITQRKVNRLMNYASHTVRDVQHAVLNLGYSADDIVASGKHLPKAPSGPDPDPVIRRLKGILCHPIGDYAVQPRLATMAAHGVTMSHYMNGASYTVGATQRISIRLTSICRNFGGDVFCDATICGILMDNSGKRAIGVRVCKTSELEAHHEDPQHVPKPQETTIYAKHIVCATSIYNLYNKFLPQDLEVVKQFQDPSKRTCEQSHGHVFLFCKLRGNASDLKLPTHNLWYFHNYDLDTAFDEYWVNPLEKRPPTVYIGFPCTKDTTWNTRFPNVSNCILISDGLYEWFESWADHTNPRHRGPDYEKFKEALTKHLLDILYECVPQTVDKVEYYHLGTPLTEVTYLGSYRGGSYGTKCVTEMFAPPNRKWTTTPHTQISNLYLAGSDAFLPSVVGAMYGGALGACAVLGHVGTMRLAVALLSHLAKNIRSQNPDMTIWGSYQEAIRCFLQ